jgi:Phage Mu protein F like protein
METLARPGLLGLAGRRAEKHLRRTLQAYFRVLGTRVIALHLEHLQHKDKTLVRHAVELKLKYWLRVMTPILKAALEDALHKGMLTADKIHHFAEASNLAEAESDDPGADIASEDYVPAMTSEEAALYASVRAGELVTGINDTTQQLIADAIETGIEDSLGVDGTAALIRDVMDSMTTYRSQMIATTELNDAFSEAALRKLDRLGIEWKQWITATACCDECAENEDESPIPIDDTFSSGDDRPPAHPNCRCAVTGARAPQ